VAGAVHNSPSLPGTKIEPNLKEQSSNVMCNVKSFIIFVMNYASVIRLRIYFLVPLYRRKYPRRKLTKELFTTAVDVQ
jgi:hypothetical protein